MRLGKKIWGLGSFFILTNKLCRLNSNHDIQVTEYLNWQFNPYFPNEIVYFLTYNPQTFTKFRTRNRIWKVISSNIPSDFTLLVILGIKAKFKLCSASWFPKAFTSVRRTPRSNAFLMRPMAESCDISLRFILLLQRKRTRTMVWFLKYSMFSVVEDMHKLDTYFFNILADSSLGSITSTAHPIDSSVFKLSNNSSLFSSFKVFESAYRSNEELR